MHDAHAKETRESDIGDDRLAEVKPTMMSACVKHLIAEHRSDINITTLSKCNMQTLPCV